VALHIKDRKTEESVRELARLRKSGLTETIREVFEAALQQERRRHSLADRLADIHAKIRSWPDTGKKLDKKFYDDLWGEDDLGGRSK
jgi:hypothetical protein